MKLALASDHAAVSLKQELAATLREQGFSADDLGTDSPASVDYPDYANKLCAGVLAGEYDFGILLCGTGVGMSIAANKHRGIRAALCSDSYTARLSREHNNANVLCLGARVVGLGLAVEIVGAFLAAEFLGGRHRERVAMLE